MVQLSVRAGHPWDGTPMGLTEGRESGMRGGLKRHIQSCGLITGKWGEQGFAGICVHVEAEGETQRRWVGTEQEERDAPAIEVTQV